MAPIPVVVALPGSPASPVPRACRPDVGRGSSLSASVAAIAGTLSRASPGTCRAAGSAGQAL